MAKSPTKSEGAFRTIREVSDWLGVPTHVLRFWESKFEQIAPVKGAGGRRYYRPEDMQLLGGIKVMLHDQGLTIRAVAQKIDDDGTAPVMALSPELDMPDRTPSRTRKVIRETSKTEDDTRSAQEPADSPPAAEETPVPETTAEIVSFRRDIPPEPAEPATPASPSASPPVPVEDANDATVDPTPSDTSDIEDTPASDPTDPPTPAPDPVDQAPVPAPSKQSDAAQPAQTNDPVPALPTRIALDAVRQSGPVAPGHRLKLRRLRRRLQALADEIREDLAEGTLR